MQIQATKTQGHFCLLPNSNLIRVIYFQVIETQELNFLCFGGVVYI